MYIHRHTRLWSVALATGIVALGSLLAGCNPSASQSSSVETKFPTVTESNKEAEGIDIHNVSDVRRLLDALPVKGRAPKTGYSRDKFGQKWADVDHNGCDTRNDILKRDLKDLKFKDGTNDCVVLSGTLDDPYTGRKISFTRGGKTSEAVQIDHVVALSDAWQKGAQELTPELREQFANDPANLLAVDGPTNQKKKDSDAATWLPPRKEYRCEYASRQIRVKSKYSLWVTKAEYKDLAQQLDSCSATY